jgi:dolichol-phosphate mannosyltransferase
MHISIVIPAYDEQGNIGRLIEEIFQTVPKQLLHEVIVVDDGSKDGTYREVSALIDQRQNLRCLRHAAKSGKSAAWRSGIEAATAPLIACVDGDGQNDPRDIARLMAKLTAPGADGTAYVTGCRTVRTTGNGKRLYRLLIGSLQKRFLKAEMPVCPVGPHLFWKDVYMRLPYFQRQHHYLPLLFTQAGENVDYLHVHHRQRLSGITKKASHLSLVSTLLDIAGLTWLRGRQDQPRVIEEIGQSKKVLSFSVHRRLGG